MTTRDIQAQLQELYGANVSHTLVSTVTEAVEAEHKAWQNRSLDAVYPIVYFDVVKAHSLREFDKNQSAKEKAEGYAQSIEF
jgi:transposase-like protein